MVQYMVNSGIVWLACLLVYELLLRKESFHQYNRIYLLASIAAGLLLPATSLNGLLPTHNTTLSQPAVQVYKIKKAIQVTQIKETSASVRGISPYNNTETILWIVYLAGVVAGLTLVIREIFGLRRLYTRGSKRREPGYIFVETGKNHCPFSFFNMLFIGSRQNYNPDQWALLVAHEKEHSRQLHSLDSLLLIIFRIVFWFHPLSYIYYKKLRMVHEFQADAAAAIDTADYGRFIVEQSLLQGAPMLVHSLNYSPIKTRITMLTSVKSTRLKGLKYLAVFPLLFMLVLFCTQTSFSEGINRKGNIVHVKGNEIEFGKLKVIPYEYRETAKLQKKMFMYTTLPDSVAVKDRVNNGMKMERISSDTMPVAINGKPIFGNEPQYVVPDPNTKYSEPVFSGSGNDLEGYIFSRLATDLDKLEDGSYIFRITRLVVDDKGNVAYYENEGIDQFVGSDEEKPAISDDIRHAIDKKIVAILDGPVKFKPALIGGKPINVRLSLEHYQVVVKNHKAKLVERGGC